MLVFTRHGRWIYVERSASGCGGGSYLKIPCGCLQTPRVCTHLQHILSKIPSCDASVLICRCIIYPPTILEISSTDLLKNGNDTNPEAMTEPIFSDQENSHYPNTSQMHEELEDDGGNPQTSSNQYTASTASHSK